MWQRELNLRSPFALDEIVTYVSPGWARSEELKNSALVGECVICLHHYPVNCQIIFKCGHFMCPDHYHHAFCHGSNNNVYKCHYCKAEVTSEELIQGYEEAN